MTNWRIFKGGGLDSLPEAPPWRRFGGKILTASRPERARLPAPSEREIRIGAQYQAEAAEIEMVDAALILRRPLLVTGKPGTGKSSLAYAVAQDLGLGPVLRWSITSRSTLEDGLYAYDVLGRLQHQQLHPGSATEIGAFLRLGPLGTALAPAERPRVLLIDEIDKSDIDLPNDLLHVFEEGAFEIPELTRLAEEQSTAVPIEIRAHDDGRWIPIERGRVTCREFPFVVLTSNGERDFPPAFLRRCLRLTLQEPSPAKLAGIVEAHLGAAVGENGRPDWEVLLQNFEARRRGRDLATDQLLNALYLRLLGAPLGEANTEAGRRLEEALLKPLSGGSAS
ncbi:MoxR family ATPase [Methylosinus sp. H3A]|uniref:AAA family ATPase n=1 Tax=Methylosinus sp. H3A TaxID=2785786 RepID=UPI0018C27B1F|nr:MoxR family ATPase [Methylosinus sp. H3A]MBG0811125.1 MoxR family ATPase [Methylosinus sp. H3A]